MNKHNNLFEVFRKLNTKPEYSQRDLGESVKIKAPIHLSGNNEDQLTKIFKKKSSKFI